MSRKKWPKLEPSFGIVAKVVNELSDLCEELAVQFQEIVTQGLDTEIMRFDELEKELAHAQQDRLELGKRITDLEKRLDKRCEVCGSTQIYHGPPDCPRCGAPICCERCCRENAWQTEIEQHLADLEGRFNERLDIVDSLFRHYCICGEAIHKREDVRDKRLRVLEQMNDIPVCPGCGLLIGFCVCEDNQADAPPTMPVPQQPLPWKAYGTSILNAKGDNILPEFDGDWGPFVAAIVSAVNELGEHYEQQIGITETELRAQTATARGNFTWFRDAIAADLDAAGVPREHDAGGEVLKPYTPQERIQWLRERIVELENPPKKPGSGCPEGDGLPRGTFTRGIKDVCPKCSGSGECEAQGPESIEPYACPLCGGGGKMQSTKPPQEPAPKGEDKLSLYKIIVAWEKGLREFGAVVGNPKGLANALAAVIELIETGITLGDYPSLENRKRHFAALDRMMGKEGNVT